MIARRLYHDINANITSTTLSLFPRSLLLPLSSYLRCSSFFLHHHHRLSKDVEELKQISIIYQVLSKVFNLFILYEYIRDKGLVASLVRLQTTLLCTACYSLCPAPPVGSVVYTR